MVELIRTCYLMNGVLKIYRCNLKFSRSILWWKSRFPDMPPDNLHRHQVTRSTLTPFDPELKAEWISKGYRGRGFGRLNSRCCIQGPLAALWLWTAAWLLHPAVQAVCKFQSHSRGLNRPGCGTTYCIII